MAQTATAVIVDLDRLFAETQLGQSYQAQLIAARDQLIAEDRVFEQELIAEERELAELKAEISAEEFAPLALAFDDKAERIRAEQDQKLADLATLREELQSSFYEQAAQVIAQVSQERNAGIVLEAGVVLMSSGHADITNDVITRLDQMFVIAEPQ